MSNPGGEGKGGRSKGTASERFMINSPGTTGGEREIERENFISCASFNDIKDGVPSIRSLMS